MKRTFLALALAAAAVPMTFAAQASGKADPPANSGAKTASTAKTHKKASHHKAMKRTTTAKATTKGSAARSAVKK